MVLCKVLDNKHIFLYVSYITDLKYIDSEVSIAPSDQKSWQYNLKSSVTYLELDILVKVVVCFCFLCSEN